MAAAEVSRLRKKTPGSAKSYHGTPSSGRFCMVNAASFSAVGEQFGFLFHQFNDADTAVRLPFCGKRLPWSEQFFAGQPAILISYEFHNGIIPLEMPLVKPFKPPSSLQPVAGDR